MGEYLPVQEETTETTATTNGGPTTKARNTATRSKVAARPVVRFERSSGSDRYLFSKPVESVVPSRFVCRYDDECLSPKLYQ